MIQEDYVSFETAKLLKEKGFDINTLMVYSQNGNFMPDGVIEDTYQTFYSAPTLQMAMKWLREVHNLCIEPYRTACGYLYTISKIPSGSELYSDEYKGDDEASGEWTTYEKAIEAAIKYCLTELIKA